MIYGIVYNHPCSKHIYLIRSWPNNDEVGLYLRTNKSGFENNVDMLKTKTFREAKSELLQYIKRKNLKIEKFQPVKPNTLIYNNLFICMYSVEINSVG